MNNNKILYISASCKNNTHCIYSGEEEFFIEIVLTNSFSQNIYIPLQFIKKSGPSIQLTNNKTNESTQLRTNLADRNLLKDLTSIAPGKSVVINWVIFKSELEQFYIDNQLDVLATIVIASSFYTKNDMAEATSFREETTLHITEKY